MSELTSARLERDLARCKAAIAAGDDPIREAYFRGAAVAMLEMVTCLQPGSMDQPRLQALLADITRNCATEPLAVLAAWWARRPVRPPELTELVEVGVLEDRGGVLIERATGEPLDLLAPLPRLDEDHTASWPGRDQETDDV